MEGENSSSDEIKSKKQKMHKDKSIKEDKCTPEEWCIVEPLNYLQFHSQLKYVKADKLNLSMICDELRALVDSNEMRKVYDLSNDGDNVDRYRSETVIYEGNGAECFLNQRIMDIFNIVKRFHSTTNWLTAKICITRSGASEQHFHTFHGSCFGKSILFRDMPLYVLVALDNLNLKMGKVKKVHDNDLQQLQEQNETTEKVGQKRLYPKTGGDSSPSEKKYIVNESKITLKIGEVLVCRGDCLVSECALSHRTEVRFLTLIMGTSRYGSSTDTYDFMLGKSRQFCFSSRSPSVMNDNRAFCFVCHNYATKYCQKCNGIVYCSNECQYVHCVYHMKSCRHLTEVLNSSKILNYKYIWNNVSDSGLEFNSLTHILPEVYVESAVNIEKCYGLRGKCFFAELVPSYFCVIHCLSHVLPITTRLLNRHFVIFDGSKGIFIFAFYNLLVELWFSMEKSVELQRFRSCLGTFLLELHVNNFSVSDLLYQDDSEKDPAVFLEDLLVRLASDSNRISNGSEVNSFINDLCLMKRNRSCECEDWTEYGAVIRAKFPSEGIFSLSTCLDFLRKCRGCQGSVSIKYSQVLIVCLELFDSSGNKSGNRASAFPDLNETVEDNSGTVEYELFCMCGHIGDSIANGEFSVVAREWNSLSFRATGTTFDDLWYWYKKDSISKWNRSHPDFRNWQPYLLFYYQKLQDIESTSLLFSQHCGLTNEGSTCFLNSCIQCLLRIQPLSVYAIEHASKNPENRLFYAYSQFLKDGNLINRIRNTKNVVTMFRSCNEGFPSNTEHDVTEALIHILNCFSGQENRDCMTVAPGVRFCGDGTNEKEISTELWGRMQQNANDVVFSLFGGLEFETTVCSRNHCFSKFEYRTITHVKLPTSSTPFTLLDLLERQTQPEAIGCKCTVCVEAGLTTVGMCQRTTHFGFNALPNILVLHLVRFEGLEKCKTSVTYPIHGLNMSTIVSPIGEQVLYDLLAVSLHLGNTICSGHYVTIACDYDIYSGNVHWRSYSDTIVSSCGCPNDLYHYENAYMLVYRRRPTNVAVSFPTEIEALGSGLLPENIIDPQTFLPTAPANTSYTTEISFLDGCIDSGKDHFQRWLEIIRAPTTNVVFMPGAGISVAAGIPTFRYANNLYKLFKRDFPHLAKIPGIENKLFTLAFVKEHANDFYAVLRKYFVGASRTCAHELMTFFAQHYNSLILTQNIDGLELQGEFGIHHVEQIHGHLRNGICTLNNSHCASDEHFAEALMNGKPPLCPQCGEIMRPNIVFLNEDPILSNTCAAKVESADVVFIMGTSLSMTSLDGLICKISSNAIIIVIDFALPTGRELFKGKKVVHLKGDVQAISKSLLSVLEIVNNLT